MATYTTWTPDLEIGCSIIDEQHQQLIAAVNNLFDAYKNGKGRKEVDQTMVFLLDYTIKHFNEEEQLQQQYDFPDHIRHKGIHADFKETAKRMTDKLSREGPSEDLISEICTTIGRWIINHIKKEDVKIAAHIKNVEQNK